MKYYSLVLILFLTIRTNLNAQLESVRVETYYVSDENDATDTDGGFLEVGSTTYRIYIDMIPGSKLVEVFGDDEHLFEISTTTTFFNHEDRNEISGHDINKSRLDEGTLPLDTWLAMGQVSRSNSADGVVLFAVPKEDDPDGSIIGGANNDGGSEEVPGGLLVNNDAALGIPLTESDGFIPFDVLPQNWAEQINPLGLPTIFDSNEESSFIANTRVMANNGVCGPIAETNEVLVAQLTTTGELSFNLNVVIEYEEEGILQQKSYVATDTLTSSDVVFAPLLSFPWQCGCTDPQFLESDPSFACSDDTQCQTAVVLGCMDEEACNFNANANVNVEELCCFVGYCNDRDISLVCPDLPEFRMANLENNISLFPNPTRKSLNVQFGFENDIRVEYRVYNTAGQRYIQGHLNSSSLAIDVSSLQKGLYFFQLIFPNTTVTKSFSVL